MDNSSILLAEPLVKSSESIDDRPVDSVRLLMGRLLSDLGFGRYHEMIFAMQYGVSKTPGNNTAHTAARSVFEYVEVHHFDLYGFLQNPYVPRTVNPKLLFPIR